MKHRVLLPKVFLKRAQKYPEIVRHSVQMLAFLDRLYVDGESVANEVYADLCGKGKFLSTRSRILLVESDIVIIGRRYTGRKGGPPMTMKLTTKGKRIIKGMFLEVDV